MSRVRLRIAAVVLVACRASPPGPTPPAPIAVEVTPARAASTLTVPAADPEPLRPKPRAGPDVEILDPAPTLSEAPFDTAAVIAAVTSVSVEPCRQPGGPTGTGHVTMTFHGAGVVTVTSVDQPPFANTPTGNCIANLYSALTIPPYVGPPVRVGASFEIAK